MIKIELLMLGTFSFFYAMAGMPPESKQGDKTDDPRKYVLLHSETPESNVSEFNCNQCSAMKDLVFVAAWQGCGNAGCGYSIFKKTEKSYEYVTNTFLHPGTFEFLKTTHQGLNDIIFYHHMSAEYGIFEKMEYDGKNYQRKKSEKIKGADLASKMHKPEVVEVVSFSKDLKKIDN